jgi:hypothetical protein
MQMVERHTEVIQTNSPVKKLWAVSEPLPDGISIDSITGAWVQKSTPILPDNNPLIEPHEAMCRKLMLL